MWFTPWRVENIPLPIDINNLRYLNSPWALYRPNADRALHILHNHPNIHLNGIGIHSVEINNIHVIDQSTISDIKKLIRRCTNLIPNANNAIIENIVNTNNYTADGHITTDNIIVIGENNILTINNIVVDYEIGIEDIESKITIDEVIISEINGGAHVLPEAVNNAPIRKRALQEAVNDIQPNPLLPNLPFPNDNLDTDPMSLLILPTTAAMVLWVIFDLSIK